MNAGLKGMFSGLFGSIGMISMRNCKAKPSVLAEVYKGFLREPGL